MREIIASSQFRKDVKRATRRGLDMSALELLIDALASGSPLPASARPHRLSGNFSGVWDAHIAPDWLLLYEITDELLILRRTGSHEDLF